MILLVLFVGTAVWHVGIGEASDSRPLSLLSFLSVSYTHLLTVFDYEVSKIYVRGFN